MYPSAVGATTRPRLSRFTHRHPRPTLPPRLPPCLCSFQTPPCPGSPPPPRRRYCCCFSSLSCRVAAKLISRRSAGAPSLRCSRRGSSSRWCAATRRTRCRWFWGPWSTSTTPRTALRCGECLCLSDKTRGWWVKGNFSLGQCEVGRRLEGKKTGGGRGSGGQGHVKGSSEDKATLCCNLYPSLL